MVLFASLAVVGTAVDMLYEDDASAAPPARPREESESAAAKGEHTKLVESRPSSYSALERQEGPAGAGGQP